MNLDQLRVLVCVSCGRKDGLIQLLGSMWRNARACVPCLQRYGMATLVREADGVLAGATPRRLGGGKCLHCGEPTLLGPDGLPSAWCSACEVERRRLVNGG